MLVLACKAFAIERCTKWSYTTKYHSGTCKIDGRTIRMRFKVEIDLPSQVPDVLGIERFVRDISEKSDTIEGYTAQLQQWLTDVDVDVRVTGKGNTKTHGVITCTFSE